MIQSVVFDGRRRDCSCYAAVGSVTRRETGKDQSLFVVVFTENLVVTQVVAISHAEPTTVVVQCCCHCVATIDSCMLVCRYRIAPRKYPPATLRKNTPHVQVFAWRKDGQLPGWLSRLGKSEVTCAYDVFRIKLQRKSVFVVCIGV